MFNYQYEKVFSNNSELNKQDLYQKVDFNFGSSKMKPHRKLLDIDWNQSCLGLIRFEGEFIWLIHSFVSFSMVKWNRIIDLIYDGRNINDLSNIEIKDVVKHLVGFRNMHTTDEIRSFLEFCSSTGWKDQLTGFEPTVYIDTVNRDFSSVGTRSGFLVKRVEPDWDILDGDLRELIPKEYRFWL